MRDLNLLRAHARRALAAAGLVSLAAGLLLLPAAAHSAAAVSSKTMPAASGKVTPHASSDSSVTVHGPHLWDPNAQKPISQPSEVTVSQTSGLVDQLIHVSWSNFTPSQTSGQTYYVDTDYYTVMAAECRGTDPTAWSDCYEDDTKGVAEASGPSGPPNATYAITSAKGTGQLDIYIETKLQNSLLGCDQNHPCSLILVPGQGGIPAQPGVSQDCADHTGDIGFANTGWALAQNTFSDPTGDCSWNDKIIIPLHFAPVPTGCPQRNAAFSVTGSPMMAVAMQQWLTGLCAGSNGMTIGYDSTTGEPTAVEDAATGLTNVALTTRSAGADGVVPIGKRTFVYAPIAISATSIAYWIDDNLPGQGQPLSGLRLNQRLLAKLLTTSYNPDIGCTLPGQTNCDAGVDNNPFDFLADSEFTSLNPDIAKNIDYKTAPTFITPTVPYGASDITWTVTRWIAANQDAASFLKGTFDPYGSHVNTYYLNTTNYPVDQFQGQDPNFPWQEEFSPVLPLAQAVTYQALSQDAGSVIPVAPPRTGFSKDPPESVGNRALIAVLDQGDAALNTFPTAAIANAAGDYVQPTNASMAAALHDMVSAGDGTLQLNLTAKDPSAYPLTMVIYAMVPTSGLSHAKAAAIARFLDFAAGAGQRTGNLPGQLPAGYLPLPSSMQAQTRKLATEVADQTGNHHPGGSTSGSPSPSSSPGNPAPITSPTSSPAGTPTTSATGPAGTHPITLVDAHTGPVSITRFVLPALLILGALAALGGSSALAGATDGGIGARLRRLSRATAARSRAVRALIAHPRPKYLSRRRKP
jgi:hypothetical protein